MGFWKPFWKRALGSVLAGALCFGALPVYAAGGEADRGAEVDKGAWLEEGAQFTGAGKDKVSALSGIDGQAEGDQLGSWTFGWSVGTLSNKSGLVIGGGLFAQVLGSSRFPGVGEIFLESKQSAGDATVTERLHKSARWEGTPGEAKCLINYTNAIWDPKLPASAFTKPTVTKKRAELLDGDTFTWETSGMAGTAPTFTRLRYVYTLDDGRTQSGTAHGDATDADGWTTTDFYDALAGQYFMLDDNPDNYDVTLDTPGMQDCTDMLHDRIVQYVTDGYAAYEGGKLVQHHTATDTLNVGPIDGSGLTGTYGTEDAGKYVHVTLKGLTGNTASVVIPVPPAYQIHYDTQGGSAVASSRKVFTGFQRNVTSEEPSLAGSSFLGWYTQPNAGGNKVEAGTEMTLTSDVTLYAAWETSYSITTEVEGGTIDPSAEGLAAGSNKVITYRPAGSDYKLSSITVDGKELSASEMEANKNRYAFNNLDSDHTIKVVYVKDVPDEYKVTTSITHGTIDPSQSQIPEGDDVFISYAPDDGYYVGKILVDGTETDPDDYPDGYPFEAIDADHTITVECKKYLKVETSVQGGTITPTDGALKEGSSKTVEYAPDDGYHLVSITVDGSTVDPEEYPSSYTFENITEDHVIRVVYEQNQQKPEPGETYKVETSIDHGTITDSRDDIPEGSDVTIDFRPDDGYYVDKILVDGEEVQNDGQTFHQFPDIDKDHTVTVTCKPFFTIDTEVVNGRITDPVGDAKEGESRTITYSPVGDCVLDYIEVDGGRVDIGEFPVQYVFRDIQENHRILVVYKAEDTFTVSTSVENGVITDSVEGIKKGADVEVKFSPNGGYVLSAIVIDGTRMGDDELKEKYGTGAPDQVYTFEDIEGNHSIQVIYEENLPEPVGDGYIEIWKTLEDVDSVVYAKGMPTFSFRIDGYDKDGVRHTFYRTLVLEEGKPSAHVRVKVPRGGYHVTELPSDGYVISGTPVTQTAQLPEDGDVSTVKLDFTNKVTDYGDYTGNHAVVNSLE